MTLVVGIDPVCDFEDSRGNGTNHGKSASERSESIRYEEVTLTI